jgi:hypothetical protein
MQKLSLLLKDKAVFVESRKRMEQNATDSWLTEVKDDD